MSAWFRSMDQKQTYQSYQKQGSLFGNISNEMDPET